MKKLLNIGLFFLLQGFINTNQIKKNQVNENQKFTMEINYIGPSDSRLSSIIFFDSCKEGIVGLNTCHFALSQDIIKEIMAIAERHDIVKISNNAMISVSINNKLNYELQKVNSFFFMSKLRELVKCKNNSTLNELINNYLYRIIYVKQ
jgi:hypothetical protein